MDGAAEKFSDVLLQNVKVLAVDQLANERQEKATVAKAVTLEVETDQAQKILLATDIGKLSLILRQAGEGHAAHDQPRYRARSIFRSCEESGPSRRYRQWPRDPQLQKSKLCAA